MGLWACGYKPKAYIHISILGGLKVIVKNNWRYIMWKDKRETWYKLWNLQITLLTWCSLNILIFKFLFLLSPLSWPEADPSGHGSGLHLHSPPSGLEKSLTPPSPFSTRILPSSQHCWPNGTSSFLTSYHHLKIHLKVFCLIVSMKTRGFFLFSRGYNPAFHRSRTQWFYWWTNHSESGPSFKFWTEPFCHCLQ